MKNKKQTSHQCNKKYSNTGDGIIQQPIWAYNISENESTIIHPINNETLTEKLTKTTKGMRLYQQERTILEITELVCQVMNKQNINHSELAKRLGKTKRYITLLLDGRTKITLRMLSDIFTALGQTIHFQNKSLETAVNVTKI